MAAEAGDVTLILGAIQQGDGDAQDRLFAAVYDELRRVAQRKMDRESPGHTLDTTGLVHEAYLRLFGDEKLSWENRAHFFTAASEAMRRILIDGARQRNAVKRGGDRKRVPLDDNLAQGAEPDFDILALDDALGKLEEQSERRARVVKLRFLLGLSVAETADVLGVAPRTVDDDWASSKAWLRRELAKGDSTVE